jgi:hypothetical protein
MVVVVLFHAKPQRPRRRKDERSSFKWLTAACFGLVLLCALSFFLCAPSFFAPLRETFAKISAWAPPGVSFMS